ncbi:hypothetical protein ACFQZT_17585 [Paenibacillus sp. GCM10027628]|uniref:hypothetical protein n=1 Tax=Paenibacillus sp. GCM10027628 TaxID=3273413 RepID=UPI00362BD309
MEGTFDLSMIVLLLGISSLIVGYYGAFLPVPLRYTDVYKSVVQFPAAKISQAAASHRLLRVRRKIPALKALQRKKDEEAASSLDHE